MDVMQKHIAHAKTLVHDNNFSIAEHMMELFGEVQIDLHILKALQDSWDKILSQILNVPFTFWHYLVNHAFLTFV